VATKLTQTSEVICSPAGYKQSQEKTVVFQDPVWCWLLGHTKNTLLQKSTFPNIWFH